MRRVFALLLCIAVPIAVFPADALNGYKVAYDGGSLQDTKVGSGLKLVIDPSAIKFLKDKTEIVTIPASAITEISYGQDVHRRVGAAIGVALVSFGIGALMALTKSKKHYIGLTWADGDKKGGLAIQCDKNEYPRNPDRFGRCDWQECRELGSDDREELVKRFGGRLKQASRKAQSSTHRRSNSSLPIPNLASSTCSSTPGSCGRARRGLT